MKLTKKLEAEILKVYHAYWDAYLKGDMKTFTSMLDENCTIIGSSENEVFNDKKAAVKFYKATAKQIAGKAEFRNRNISMMPVGNSIMVNEQSDFFVLIDNNWTFYGNGRISTQFHKKNNKWKIIHQHGSLPDSKAGEGEQISTDKIKAENIQLRDAVKRRTIELEDKNRELEIESSLEKVRTVAMAMRNRDDMLNICRTMSAQLELLGIKEIRNVQTAIFYKDKGIYVNYEYYRLHEKALVTEVDYTADKLLSDFAAQMTSGTNEIFIQRLTGKQVKDWLTFQKTTNVFIDTWLEKAKSLTYYFYSLGPVALGISTYDPLNEEEINLFKRFRNVFGLAYQRYIDLEKAEAQAQEAKIEASLERMRAVAMSMRKSEELIAVCEAMYKELTLLGFTNIRNAQVAIKHGEKQAYLVCEYSDYVVNILQEAPYDSSAIVKELYNELGKTSNALYQKQFSGKEFEEWRTWRKGIKDNIDVRIDTAVSMCFYLYSMGTGHVGISTFNTITNEQIEILKRFKNVFELSYQRYTDVANAEAQAREAQIELALERVRARTMAMQKSEELAETSLVLFQQFKDLGETSEQISIGIFKEDEHIMELYSTLYGSQWKEAAKVDLDEPVVMKKIHTAWKDQNKSLVLDIAGNDLQKYNAYRKKLSNLEYREDRWVIHIAFFSKGVLTFSITEPYPPETIQLLERFAAVFDQTYTRFLDLQKAEAQAKEAQVQLALERVRARTMAMQHSNELQEVVNNVYERLSELEVEMDGAAICTFIEGSKDYHVWIGGLPEKLRIKFNDLTQVQRDYNDVIERRDELFTKTYSGKIKKEYISFLLEETVLKSTLPEDQKQMLMASDFFTTVISCTKNTASQLYRYNGKPFLVEETDILKRFAKVFEQAYIRFLDLQKAEAQARESQIELGLERVRARAMAMQKSDELSELVSTVFKELTKLDFALTWCIINIIDESSMSNTVWAANPDINKAPESYHMLFEDYPFHHAMMKGWKERKTKSVYTLEGDEKRTYDEYLFNETEFRKVPEAAQAASRAMEKYVVTFSFSNFGGLQTVGDTPLSDANLDILSRFGKVFDLTYTRFNDLKQAEAQARESQIQLALERVRARTMAMQRSDELSETVFILFQQFKQLGENPDQATIGIINEDEWVIEYWVTMYGNQTNRVYKFPIDEPNVTNKIYKGWKEQKKSLVIDLSGKELYDFATFRESMGGAAYNEKEKKRVINIAFFSKGLINVQSNESRSAESILLLERFAGVFEQTYTRFLDLQKAEAQAREAQIELGLERVRARAMAMRNSDELGELVAILFEELLKLDLILARCIIWIFDSDTLASRVWMANSEDRKIADSYYIKRLDHSYYDAILKGWKERNPKWAYDLSGKYKKSLDELLLNETELSRLPEAVKVGIRSSEHTIISGSFNDFGFIEASGPVSHSEEQFEILNRFGKVFDLSYTRFNDLKQAEAQAREAQIEAALERVRSRSMGMQKSEELKEVIQVVYEQFVHLNIKIEHTGFVIDYKARDDYDIWIADPLGVPSQVTVPYFDCAYYNRFNEAKEKGEDFFATNLSFEEKNKFYQKLFEYVPGLPEEAKKFYFSCPGLAASTVLLDNVCLYIENFSGTPYTDEENNTLMRFGKVFQQTYTRFLDLQKAEAQAREAKIEAALEKVRSRSLAMHKSDELNEVVTILFEKIKELQIPVTAVGIGIYIDGSKDMNTYVCGENEDRLVINNYCLPYFHHKIWKDLNNAREKQLDFFSGNYSKEEKNSFYKYVLEHSALRHLPDDIKSLIFESPAYTISMAPVNHSMFMINDFEGKILSENEVDIIKRFARVFDQAYTRFLDLQKAEAQAREAKIEAALERVRSRSLAMHTSEELQQVVTVVFERMNELHITMDAVNINIFNKGTRDVNLWVASPGQDYAARFHLPYTDLTIPSDIFNAREKGDDFFAKTFSFEDKNKYFNYLFEHSDFKHLPDNRKNKMLAAAAYTVSFAFTKNAAISIHNYSDKSFSDEENNILKRFGKVFEQTYTRFLDLQKSEAQAREAKIEAALERTRTQSMIMQHSKELDDTLRVFHEQVLLLGINSAFSFLWLPDEEKDRHIFWAAWAENNSKVFRSKAINYPLDRNEPATAQCLVDWKRDEPVVSYHVPPAGVESYFAAWQELIAGVEQLKPEYFRDGLYYVEAFMKYGCFGVMAATDLTEDEKKILGRFAIEFERTYTRFLDLQKAEAQAREAKIEAALEKVRSKTMAMHNSQDVGDTVAALFDEFVKLGIETFRCGIGIIHQERKMEVWTAKRDANGKVNFFTGYMDMTMHPLLQGGYSAWKKKQESYLYDLKGDDLKEYFSRSNNNPNYPLKYDIPSLPPRLIFSVFYFPEGFLFAFTLEEIPAEATKIFKRFSGVFGQTYRRYLDLQKAEAQAREAQIQLAMERVRARTMAMQKSDELIDAASLLFKQIADLGTKQWSSGFDIWNTNEISAVAWMSNPDGSMGKPFTVPYTEDPFFIQIYKAKQSGNDFFVMESGGKELEETYEYLFNLPDARKHFDGVESLGFQMPKFQITHCAFFSQGFLMFITYEPVPEMWDVFKRFAKVFEQTYTRFLDLQKAEAQAREAKIEAALEKVRSRSMGMQKSEELKEVIQVVYEQFVHLNIHVEHTGFIMDYKERDDMHIWLADKHAVPFEVTIPYFDCAHWNSFNEAKKKGLNFFANHLSFEEKNKFYQDLFKLIPGVPEETLEYYFSCPGLAISTVLLENVGLYIENFSGILYSDEENGTLMRFGKVFQQTYTRFLDLQKAEAQAREAQIEAALERVRSKTMAMHNSQDVGDTVITMFDQLIKLGVTTNRCGILIFSNTNNTEVWTAKSNPTGEAVLIIGHLDVGIHPMLQGVRQAWKNKETFYSYELAGDDIKNYYSAINNYPGYPTRFNLDNLLSKETHSDFFFSEGAVFAFTSEPIAEEAALLFKRFAGVFGQTYRRYLDLQKAEAQTRDAKIEAAMEKVRARAMAMQKPGELVEVAQLLRKEMGLLGVEELETSSIYIHDEVSGTTECWYAIQDIREENRKLVTDHMTIQLNDTWVGREMLKFYTSDQKQTSILMQGENRKEWINYCAQHSKVLQGYYGDTIPERTYHLLKFSSGYMGAASPGDISAESWELLKRATTVFSLAYTRFSDLQIAEANAKEAIKQSALDRIRADIASMRTIADLDKITPLIWNELTILGIPFIRCGVFIMDESQKLIHTFLSTPDGKAIAAFHLPYDTPGNIGRVLHHWRDNKNYIDHWDESAFRNLADMLVKQGAIASPGQYLNTIPDGGFYLHFLPFLQGMLYVGNTTQLPGDEIKLIQSVADAFSTAYARYEDFNKLEAAKQQVDKTLVDLKQAQTQLVQSEKMASLGELTAGIAHEIQNPLNFVNNFSDVSSELLDEMKTELKKGNTDEAMYIAEDVQQNLEKILHHGKRADAIVKGMLQHSRMSSGQKELTDINNLADEYLRLAYHGLRAKDKSFNAKFETHLDKNVGKINIIPQDIGRVLVNLITNAFHAVSQRQKAESKQYEPTVSVTTKKIADKSDSYRIEIIVKDNGTGIPQKVLDKIFQPFFTTKPTGQGTGLGLSLAYDIVKAHGGEIKVGTKEGEGSEFIISLPVT